jgi:hypothetical protein
VVPQKSPLPLSDGRAFPALPLIKIFTFNLYSCFLKSMSGPPLRVRLKSPTYGDGGMASAVRIASIGEEK